MTSNKSTKDIYFLSKDLTEVKPVDEGLFHTLVSEDVHLVLFERLNAIYYLSFDLLLNI